MVTHIFIKEKGQTLLEVVVALGILAMVFAGTITLIVSVVSLNIDARNVTQATAIADQGIADHIAGIKSKCSATLPPDVNTPINRDGKEFDKIVSASFADVNANGNIIESAESTAKYILIESSIGWEDKSGNYRTHIVKQLLKRT